LIVGSKEISLEVNVDNTKYMVMSRNRNAGRSHGIKTDISFQRVENFKHLGTNLTNQNSFHEEIERRLKSGNAAIIRCRIFCFPFCYPKISNIKIYGNIIVLVVLYGCETWWLIMREVRRLRVFENRVLRRMFGPKRHKATWNGEKYVMRRLCNLYSLPNIFQVIKSRRMRWAGLVTLIMESRGVYRVLVGKPEEKRPLGRPSHRWEDNIKMGLQEVGSEGTDWIDLAQDTDRWRTLVNAVMNIRVP